MMMSGKQMSVVLVVLLCVVLGAAVAGVISNTLDDARRAHLQERCLQTHTVDECNRIK